MKTKLLACLALVTLSLPEIAMSLEEPEYEVIAQNESFELRRYAPYIVAEVDVEGDFKSQGNEAFKILAGYIFGDNRAATKMAMTAPVESRPQSEKMAMTTPVTSAASADTGRSTFAFVMERKYSLDTLPVPNDRRIRIRTMPERVMAVRRYSGRWTDRSYLRNEAALLSGLEALQINPIGDPVLARYNSPFSLPFMRRNEVMVEVDPANLEKLAQ